MKYQLLQNNEVEFDSVFHWYQRTDGSGELSGVTALMDRHNLRPDYSDIPQQILREAADKGSDIHEAINALLVGAVALHRYDRTREVLHAFHKEVLPKHNFIASEYLVSDNTRYATMIDIVEEVEEGVILWEIKNTSTLHWGAVAWQLSIAEALFSAQNPTIPVVGYRVLHTHDALKEYAVDAIPQSEVLRLFAADERGELYVPRKAEVPVDVEGVAEMLKNTFNNLELLKNNLTRLEEDYKRGLEVVRKYMQAQGIKVWEFGGYRFTRVAGSERKTIKVDTKKLQEEHPQVYAEVAEEKTTAIAESIRMKVE